VSESTTDNSERGSVLTFGIGLAILLLMLVTVSVNLASVWTTKVTLRTITDGAALSGAQGVDLSDVYKSGTRNSLQLSPKSARIRIDKYLNQPSVRKRVHGLQVVSITVAGDEVKVVLSCDPQLPFGYLLPAHVSRIQAMAVAKQFTH